MAPFKSQGVGSSVVYWEEQWHGGLLCDLIFPSFTLKGWRVRTMGRPSFLTQGCWEEKTELMKQD